MHLFFNTLYGTVLAFQRAVPPYQKGGLKKCLSLAENLEEFFFKNQLGHMSCFSALLAWPKEKPWGFGFPSPHEVISSWIPSIVCEKITPLAIKCDVRIERTYNQEYPENYKEFRILLKIWWEKSDSGAKSILNAIVLECVFIPHSLSGSISIILSQSPITVAWKLHA